MTQGEIYQSSAKRSIPMCVTFECAVRHSLLALQQRWVPSRPLNQACDTRVEQEDQVNGVDECVLFLSDSGEEAPSLHAAVTQP